MKTTTKFNKTATIADPSILNRYSAIDISSESEQGISVLGWSFTSRHGTIADEVGMLHLEKSIIPLANSEAIMRIPEMIFDRNFFNIVHIPNNISLNFNAFDSLTAWSSRQNIKPNISNENYTIGKIESPPKIISVPYANNWKENSITENIKVLPPWDWTFCTDYCGSISAIDKLDNNLNINPSYKICNIESDHVDRYIFTPKIINEISQDENKSEKGLGTRIRTLSTNEKGIDFDLLRRKDEILFYDEMVLYQGDLEDCGEVILDAKIRVMPSCWFLLLRLFMRVDNTETRIRSYRYFHSFGSNKIDVDICWQEDKASRLKVYIDNENSMKQIDTFRRFSTGASASSSGSAAESIPNASDLNLLRDSNRLSQIMTVVNEAEGFDKAYAINLF